MRPVGALVPYASNSRTHTPDQIAKIAKSIESFGWTNPILVDGENGILAGHARLKAAQQLGLAQVPTIELSWLTPAERQALVIADNQLAITGAGWDAQMLRLELGDLKLAGFDLSLTGFDELERSRWVSAYSSPESQARSSGLYAVRRAGGTMM
jgi:ParB-like chromosome segregation protein Spo0J